MEILQSIAKKLVITGFVCLGAYTFAHEHMVLRQHQELRNDRNYQTSSLRVYGSDNLVLNGSNLPDEDNLTMMGSVPVGQSINVIYTIENNGTEIIALSQAYLAGGHAAFFQIEKQPKKQLNPGEKTELEISYSSEIVGEKTVTVAFTSSDINQSSYSFEIGAATYQIASSDEFDNVNYIDNSGYADNNNNENEYPSYDDQNLVAFSLNADIDKSFSKTKIFGPNNGFSELNESEIAGFCLGFDGSNSYAQSASLLTNSSEFTLMGWIKLSPNFQNAATILGQGSVAVSVSSDSKINASVGNSNIQVPISLEKNRWYQVSLVFNSEFSSDKVQVFINGEKLASSGSQNVLIPSDLHQYPFILGKNTIQNSGFFNGFLDEIRVVEKALSNNQIQSLVYQELSLESELVQGKIVSESQSAFTKEALLGYFPITTINDQTSPNLGNESSVLSLINGVQILPQTAPMPFQTRANGSLYQSVSESDVRGTDLLRYPWSIVKINHKVEISANQSNYGMIVAPNGRLTVKNQAKLENTRYLKLDGVIDLEDKSQLVQTENSVLDIHSAGYMERDQRGTTNPFNYNYWSSMVSSINDQANNNEFSVGEILRDGTIAQQPSAISWINDITPPVTQPISLSGYWIFKFQNLTSSYSNWGAIGPNGKITPGQGFTLKGSGSNSTYQNYVFIGKPNNGNIQIPIAPNNLNLTGNPYPSALDAHKFIRDNADSLLGALYFWEHYDSNQTHITQNYQGGYAVRTLVGGTPPVAPAGISNSGSSSDYPNRFIPVGQGFFVRGNTTGGNIKFSNSQRIFIRENNVNSQPIFRTNLMENSVNLLSNSEDNFEDENYAKVRLGYTFVNGYRRQILLGFMNDEATSGFDVGYDAVNNDSNPDEMTFKLGARRCVILGEGHFDPSVAYPIEVKSHEAGTVSFSLDGLENFNDDQPVYMYDAITDSYHNLRNSNYEFTVEVGTFTNRFYLTFYDPNALSISGNDREKLQVIYNPDQQLIGIKQAQNTDAVTELKLYSMLGQLVQSKKTANENASEIQWNVNNLAQGSYVLEIISGKSKQIKKIQIY